MCILRILWYVYEGCDRLFLGGIEEAFTSLNARPSHFILEEWMVVIYTCIQNRNLNSIAIAAPLKAVISDKVHILEPVVGVRYSTVTGQP